MLSSLLPNPAVGTGAQAQVLANVLQDKRLWPKTLGFDKVLAQGSPISVGA